MRQICTEAVCGHCLGQDLSRFFPTLCAEGIDLMDRMFAYNPADRITVRAAAATLSGAVQ